MDNVKVGIIGCGGMGAHHFGLLKNGGIPGAELRAVCDVSPERIQWASSQGVLGLQCFDSPEAFFAGADVDGVLIATPHYDHPPLAIQAFEKGWHVLTEKPAGVYTRQVREMNAAAARSGKVFGIMFNLRTLKTHQKMRDLVTSGELGEIRRINWIATSWFRTQAYYDNGGWRATWSGEGGGVLINQCPHNLDLWQWICGMPRRMLALCRFGKYHQIEVEDDVTAMAEYENGATAVFITSTGEAPGTNRLEVVGDMGRLVLEDGHLTFMRNRQPMDRFLRESTQGFATPECWKVEVPGGDGPQHRGITMNWIEAIRNGTPLLAPGEEGVRSLELSNAMLLSAWTGNWVDLPVDEDLFVSKLRERAATSTYAKKGAGGRTMDVKGTF